MYTLTTGNPHLKSMNMTTPFGSIAFEDGVATGVTEEQAMFFEGNPHYEIKKDKKEKATSEAPKVKANGKNGKGSKKAAPKEADVPETADEPEDLDL